LERKLVLGIEVDYAGKRWRVQRILGPDAVLLANDTGEVTSADPVRIVLWPEISIAPPDRVTNERRYSEDEWAKAIGRRDILVGLARRRDRSSADIADAAKALGIKRRRVFGLLQNLDTAGGDVAIFLPKRGASRSKRLEPATEAIIALAIDQHYATASRPSLLSLHRTVSGRCTAAGFAGPSYRSVQDRVRGRDQAWLTRRREGPKAARALRLLIGAHPGAAAPWERVQIDSTPCDIRLVREVDRAVIGRPNFTIAVDVYSRVIPGFSVSLESASTITVATCLAHACLPKDEWLTQRNLAGVHWPIYGKPGILEYDQGSENEAHGIQRGLRRHGIASKVRAKGHPEHHGIIERLIGTMMRIVHELRGTTFSNVNERGESETEKRACLTVAELERVLALAIDSYNHTIHDGIGERPMDRYLAWYRRPELADADRIPPRLPAERLLLDFLPFENRALLRTGIRLFRVDYSCSELQPLWRRDNQARVERIVVYDPRSLTQIWVLDEATDQYITVPTRVPRPDMTLAQSVEARRALRAAKAQDRTEARLFENLAGIKAIEATASNATARHKAERSRLAAKGVRKSASGIEGGQTPAAYSPSEEVKPLPEWSENAIEPFTDVERF
jgi:putative transposase